MTGDILDREQVFFDAEADSLNDEQLVIAPDQMARYREARPSPFNMPKDTLFSLLRPLEGRRVLEYGCGMGETACHLADCGARVSAFDLSASSVAKARQRAEALGLGDQIEFDVRTAGRTGYRQMSFDVVVGEAILHHLHSDLSTIYDELAALLTPTGTAYFIEPVANSRFLQCLRNLVPIRRYATPDERQLHYDDLELMKRHGFARVEYRHFYCLGRLRRLTGGCLDRRLCWLDHYIQRSAPFLKRFYGVLLVAAHKAPL
jgi:SAM-dependent methyltransferase